jgi:hypothetical protein
MSYPTCHPSNALTAISKVARLQGGQPAAAFYSFGHPTLNAYVIITGFSSENGEPLMPPEILTWFQSRGLTVVSDGAQGDANQGHTLTVSDDRIPLSISQGQTLTLTEAGRLALEETQENRLVTGQFIAKVYTTKSTI